MFRYWLPYLLTVLALLALLPFLVLAGYAHPYFDDYGTDLAIGRAGFVAYFTDVYQHWSGRYAFLLANSGHPLRFGWLTAYRLAAAGLVVGLGLGCYACMAGVSVSSRLPKRSVVALGSGLLLAVLVLLPSPAEGFYWILGGYNYTLPIIVGLLAGGLGLWLARPVSASLWHRPGQITFLLLVFLFPGFSEFSACLTLLVALVLGLAFPQAGRFWQFAVLVAGAGALLMLAAPGNFGRYHAHRSLTFGALPRLTLLASLATAYTLLNWLLYPVLWALLGLSLPLLQRIGQQPRSPATRLTASVLLWPGLLLAGVFGCYLFSYLTIGGAIPLRARNLLYVYTLTTGLLSALGIVRHLHANGRQIMRLPPIALLLLLTATLLYDANPRLRDPTNNPQRTAVATAYQDWLGGRAGHYDAALQHRYKLLRQITTDSVDLPPLIAPPSSLFYYDLSENPAAWGNQSMALYFGKKAVWLQSGSASK